MFFEPEPDGETHTITDRESMPAGDARLDAELEISLESNGESTGARWALGVTLTKGGAIVATESLVPQAGFSRVERFEVERGVLVLEAAELPSDCGVGQFREEYSVRYSIRSKKDSITIERKVTGSDGGLCSPSPEGLGGCDLARLMARFTELEPVCRGRPRSVCEDALARWVDDTSCDDGAGADPSAGE